MAPIAPVVKVKALRSSNYSSITKNPRSAKISSNTRTHAPPAGGGDDDVETDDRTGATVSATALHALGSAGEACAAVVRQARSGSHSRMITVLRPPFETKVRP